MVILHSYKLHYNFHEPTYLNIIIVCPWTLTPYFSERIDVVVVFLEEISENFENDFFKYQPYKVSNQIKC